MQVEAGTPTQFFGLPHLIFPAHIVGVSNAKRSDYTVTTVLSRRFGGTTTAGMPTVTIFFGQLQLQPQQYLTDAGVDNGNLQDLATPRYQFSVPTTS